MTDQQFQDHALRGVSRTFALTIPQLPPPLSAVVANAYLLCRVADVIEDEPALAPEQKRAFSRRFIEAIEGTTDPDRLAAELYPLLTERTIPAERELIANVARVIRITLGLPADQRAVLHRAVSTMAEGMSAFQARDDGAGLANMRQLDSYCYYVAGIVGEMLTELFCGYSEEIARNRATMMELAVSFGQGLQMTNILKDFWEDRARGACWLPFDVFEGGVLDLTDPAGDNREAFGRGLERLIAVTRKHLENALAYSLLIPRRERGIRRFCLWAIGMAVLTLRKIHGNPGYRSGREVTISRRSVKGIIVATRVGEGADWTLKLLFSLATRGLPGPTPAALSPQSVPQAP